MYEWREHTAELELVVEARSEEEVFATALDAFGRLIERGDAGEPATEHVNLEADDRPALLVAWLEELIFLADTRSFVPDRARSLALDDHRLTATLEGRVAEVDPLVKAATYHGLRFAHDGEVWRGTVVLDV